MPMYLICVNIGTGYLHTWCIDITYVGTYISDTYLHYRHMRAGQVGTPLDLVLWKFTAKGFVSSFWLRWTHVRRPFSTYLRKARAWSFPPCIFCFLVPVRASKPNGLSFTRASLAFDFTELRKGYEGKQNKTCHNTGISYLIKPNSRCNKDRHS